VCKVCVHVHVINWINLFYVIIYIGPSMCFDWSQTHVLSENNHSKSLFYCFSPHYQMWQKTNEKPKSWITQWQNTPDIWEQLIIEENTCLQLSCFLHFPHVLKYPLCFITVYYTALRLLYLSINTASVFYEGIQLLPGGTWADI